MAKIIVQNTEISIVTFNNEDYISQTDMAKSQFQEHIIFRWLSLKSTIEYLGEWEMHKGTVSLCTKPSVSQLQKHTAGLHNNTIVQRAVAQLTDAQRDCPPVHSWSQILGTKYGEIAIIKMFNPINKTKPDSLTCVRGYRESALQI